MWKNSFACDKTVYSLGYANVEYPYGYVYFALHDAIEVDLGGRMHRHLLLPLLKVLRLTIYALKLPLSPLPSTALSLLPPVVHRCSWAIWQFEPAGRC